MSSFGSHDLASGRAIDGTPREPAAAALGAVAGTRRRNPIAAAMLGLILGIAALYAAGFTLFAAIVTFGSTLQDVHLEGTLVELPVVAAVLAATVLAVFLVFIAVAYWAGKRLGPVAAPTFVAGALLPMAPGAVATGSLIASIGALVIAGAIALAAYWAGVRGLRLSPRRLRIRR